MGRYEAARDFWSIDLTGRTLVTTTGRKTGTTGKTTAKSCKTEAAALLEYTKLIEAKTRSRYRLVRPQPSAATRRFGKAEVALPATAPAEVAAYNKRVAGLVAKGHGEDGPRNRALEEAIEQNPYDAAAYSVLADWLQAQGDPRGELIALQLAGKDRAARDLLSERTEYFLGPLAAHAECYDHLYYKPSPPAFLWRYGFIHGLRISNNKYFDDHYAGDIADVLELVLRHPSGRFVTEVTLMDNGGGSDVTLQSVIDRLAKLAPPTVRKLVIGDQVDQISWYRVGDLGKLWRALPHLEVLEIEAGEFTLGALELPELRRAVFKTGGLSKASARSIARANWPRIEHLDVYFGDSMYGGDCKLGDLAPLLARTDLPALRHLGLCAVELADDLCGALPRAAIVKQLRELDLSQGIMTDAGAEALAAHKAAFAHLAVLDLSDNYLSRSGVAAVTGLAKHVETGDQKDDEGDPEMRWVSVGE